MTDKKQRRGTNYTVKPTKKQLVIIKGYWKTLKKHEGDFHKRVYALEKTMSKEVGINNLEFFMCDNEYVGVGNTERTMKLLQREELE